MIILRIRYKLSSTWGGVILDLHKIRIGIYSSCFAKGKIYKIRRVEARPCFLQSEYGLEPRMRAGRYITQLEGYRAFIPAPLPPDPPISMDAEMVSLLSEADHALGRLDGVASILPNPDLFVATYVRHEAVLSSQIEGTQSSLEDVLEYEAGGKDNGLPHDVEDVVNYVRAMNHGLSRLKVFPLSLRLIREIHAELLRGVRGGEKDPGNFRRTQNWIGPKDAPLQTAVFVPPPAHEITAALDNLEKFLHETEQLPAL